MAVGIGLGYPGRGLRPVVYRIYPILKLWWIILSPEGGLGTCRSVRRAGVPGNVVDRLDKGLHVGEETDPCTEIPGGSVAVSWPAREFLQIST